MIFSLCLSRDEINVALDPVAAGVAHAPLWVTDYIYLLACLPSH